MARRSTTTWRGPAVWSRWRSFRVVWACTGHSSPPPRRFSRPGSGTAVVISGLAAAAVAGSGRRAADQQSGATASPPTGPTPRRGPVRRPARGHTPRPRHRQPAGSKLEALRRRRRRPSARRRARPEREGGPMTPPPRRRQPQLHSFRLYGRVDGRAVGRHRRPDLQAPGPGGHDRFWPCSKDWATSPTGSPSTSRCIRSQTATRAEEAGCRSRDGRGGALSRHRQVCRCSIPPYRGGVSCGPDVSDDIFHGDPHPPGFPGRALLPPLRRRPQRPRAATVASPGLAWRAVRRRMGSERVSTPTTRPNPSRIPSPSSARCSPSPIASDGLRSSRSFHPGPGARAPPPRTTSAMYLMEVARTDFHRRYPNAAFGPVVVLIASASRPTTSAPS